MSKLNELLSKIISKLNASVKTEAQSFSEAEKAQARENIGALSANATINGKDLTADTTLTADDVGVYVQSEEPVDAVDGDIWVDVDAESHLNPEIVIVSDAVKYTAQTLTEEQKVQARENIGALVGGQLVVRSLYNILQNCTYINDQSNNIGELFRLMGGKTDVMINTIVKGSFTAIATDSTNTMYSSLSVNRYNAPNRAVMFPFGQYLQHGITYKTSLGSISKDYYYSAVFYDPGVYNFNTIYNPTPVWEVYLVWDKTYTKRYSTSWTHADKTYTPTNNTTILVVNFKRTDDATMTDDDFNKLLANFTLEVV